MRYREVDKRPNCPLLNPLSYHHMISLSTSLNRIRSTCLLDTIIHIIIIVFPTPFHINTNPVEILSYFNPLLTISQYKFSTTNTVFVNSNCHLRCCSYMMVEMLKSLNQNFTEILVEILPGKSERRRC